MFGTIIMDSYKSDEVELMSQYIDDLCSPMDLYGWASIHFGTTILKRFYTLV